MLNVARFASRAAASRRAFNAAAVAARCQEILDARGVAGASAAVLVPDGRGGAAVEPVVAGLADVAANRPVGADTWFQLASLSKPIAAARARTAAPSFYS